MLAAGTREPDGDADPDVEPPGAAEPPLPEAVGDADGRSPLQPTTSAPTASAAARTARRASARADRPDAPAIPVATGPDAGAA